MVDQSATDDGTPFPLTIDIDMDTGIGGNAWYNSPTRGATGFFYSAIAGGARPSNAQRESPAYSPSEIYNGDFEIVNTLVPLVGVGHAGWRYHGGDKSGVATPWNSTSPPPGSKYYLTLIPVDSSLTHNRLYVDESIRTLRMDFRVFTPDAISLDDEFRVSLVDDTGSQLVGTRSAAAATGWHEVEFAVPTNRRGTMQRLRLELDGGGTGILAIVDVDNLEFEFSPVIPTLSQTGLIALGLLLSGAMGVAFWRRSAMST